MGDLNRDRFGVPIETKRRQFPTPGPGSYMINPSVSLKNPKLGVIGLTDRNYTFGVDTKEVNPGPAYYDPPIHEKKVSFHYDRIE